MNPLVEALLAFLVLAGAAFALLGSLGLARFPDFYMRLHGPSKATTLGIGCLLLASLLFFGLRGSLSMHEVLITLFVSITTPVSAHLLGRAALHRERPVWRGGGAVEGPPEDRGGEPPAATESPRPGAGS